MRGLAVVIAVAIATASGAPHEVRGQTELRGPASPGATAEPLVIRAPAWAARFDLVTRRMSPVAGVAIALPVGSSGDPVGAEGAGWVLADAVVREVEGQVGSGRVEAGARVDPLRTTFTFVVRTEAVADLLEAFRRVAFEAGPGAEAVGAARDERIADLVFQQDSPVREVDRESRALIYGSGEDRVHAPGGRLSSVEGLDAAAVEGVRRSGYDPGAAVVSVVGAVALAPETRPAGTAPADTLRPQDPPPAEARTLSGRVDAPADGDALAWTEGARRVVEREVTNSWIVAAWPVPRRLSRVAVDFVAHRMERELNPSPPEPGVFSADVEIIEMPEGEVLVVSAAVQPRRAAAMESRILSLPSQLSTPPGRTFFLWYRRQFRADRLVADAPPEAEARRRGREILARGSALDVAGDVWSLTPDGIAETAAALGQPRVLVFGPPRGGN